jgi:cobalt-zinc-cadmium resistance protein CzcA
MKLVAASRRRAVAIYLLLALLAGGGAWQAMQMPSSIFPSVTFPLVKVIASVGDEPAAQVMPTVTRPMEEALLRVPGVVAVRSKTSRGSAELAAQFSWGTDMKVALQRADAEVQRIRPDLPPNTKVDVEWMNPAVFPILGYALTSDTLSQAQLRELADFTLKPQLFRVPGVSRVYVLGGLQREFEVVLDRAALESRHLSAADVVTAIQKSNQVISAGLTEQNHELYLTLVSGRVASLEELQKLSVPVQNGIPASLGQLGKVQVADEVSYVRTTSANASAVLVNVIRQPTADTVAIARGVDEMLKSHPELLPKGVHWSAFYDQAQYVSNSVTGVRDAILIGVALAALVLLLFLRSFRLTLVATVAIPLCVAIVAGFIGALGQTINLMTLAGIAAALGLIADDAIVVIENIARHRQEKLSGDPAESGLREILPALIGSSLSTIVIFIPFSQLSGVVGAFFKPLALTMAVTLAVSFCIAAFVVPASVALLGEPAMHAPRRTGLASSALARGASWLGDRGGRGYSATVRFFLRHGSAAAVVVVLLLAGAFFLYGRIGTDFLPAMDEGSIILDYWTPPGTSLTDTDAMLVQAEKVISALPDVAAYSRRTGAQLGFSLTEPNRGDYVIRLKPLQQRRGVDAVIADLRARLAAVEPAVHTDFGQLLEDNIGDLSGGTPQPIDIKLFGDQPDALSRTAKSVAESISKVSGVEDVFDGIVVAGPGLLVNLDPVAAARFGLTTDSLHAAVEPAVTGTVAGQVRVGERMYDLRVLARTPLRELQLRTPSGALIPLSQVARVETGKPETEIDRENLKTYVGVTARLGSRSLGAAMTDVRARVEPIISSAAGVTVAYGGTYAQQQQSFRALFFILIGGLLLVGIVLLFEFGDWRAPLVTALVALSVLSGVLLALQLTGMTLNISSYVGAIMMVGIVGENAIFVLQEARFELRKGTGVQEAWEIAAQRRLRPVAMTVLATSLALSPLAFALGAGAQLMQPLAIAVIGGFVLSGPAVLLLVPGLYCLLDPHGRLAGRDGPAAQADPARV